MISQWSPLLLVFLGRAFGGDPTPTKVEVFNCELTQYENVFYQADSILAANRAYKYNSLEECLSWCLLRPECQSINANKDFYCTFHKSGVQDLKENLSAKQAKLQNGWKHYRIVGCPEETSSAPVECGKQSTLHLPSFTRIIGGKEARANSWPWQASLTATSASGAFACGASLIRVKDDVEASDMLVTAGHCVSYMLPNSTNHTFYEPRQMTAILGTHNKDKYSIGVQVRIGDRILAHPDFSLSKVLNDIALIRLSKPVKFTNKIRPICLPDQGEALPVGKLCAAAGWGRVNSTNRESSPLLKELSMPVHDATVCKRGWRHQYIEEQMVCAGNLNGDSGTCNGDSGGMLACKDGGKWVLNGVTSFGVKDICVQANAPKVFARVSSYVDWIRENVAAMTAL